MSTAAVLPSGIDQGLQTYFQERSHELRQLGQALQSGDLAAAKHEFREIGQNGPFASGNSFLIAQRQQDFEKIGRALQAGDLAAAKQAFAELRSTVHRGQQDPTPVAVVNFSGPPTPAQAPPPAPNPDPAQTGSGSGAQSTGSSTAPASGTEIVLNLGNIPAGEKITIGLKETDNGGEQVKIKLSNDQGQASEKVVLNLQPSSNQQIIVNLFNSAASPSTNGSGVSVSA